MVTVRKRTWRPMAEVEGPTTSAVSARMPPSTGQSDHLYGSRDYSPECRKSSIPRRNCGRLRRAVCPLGLGHFLTAPRVDDRRV